LDRSLLSLDFVLETVFGNRVVLSFSSHFFSFAYILNQNAYYNEMSLYDNLL
jgi:hypothetical protein